MIARYKKSTLVRRFITILAVVASALLQIYVIQALIWPANLLSSGFTSVAILIDRIASLYRHSISTSLGMLILNISVVVLCSRSISIRFTFYSMLQVFLVSFFLKICSLEPLFNDVLLDVVFDGFLYRLSTAIALRGSVSTGGTDFITLYVFSKTGRSIWEHVFTGNCVILCIFDCMFGWLCAGYSIPFQFVSTKVISVFHHRYERATLQIIATKTQDITNQYVKQYRYGIPCVDVVGGYSRKKMYLLHTVVSSYEVNGIVYLMREQDPYVIVNMIKAEDPYGEFYQAPIE